MSSQAVLTAYDALPLEVVRSAAVEAKAIPVSSFRGRQVQRAGIPRDSHLQQLCAALKSSESMGEWSKETGVENLGAGTCEVAKRDRQTYLRARLAIGTGSGIRTLFQLHLILSESGAELGMEGDLPSRAMRLGFGAIVVVSLIDNVRYELRPAGCGPLHTLDVALQSRGASLSQPGRRAIYLG